MSTQEITPEYIASIAKTLTEEELAEMIRQYGDLRADDSEYWASKNGGEN